jgi:hypothetical protein
VQFFLILFFKRKVPGRRTDKRIALSGSLIHLQTMAKK